MFDLKFGDVQYTAASLSGLRDLLDGDVLARIARDGNFDFTSLDPQVVEVMYGKGCWWKCRTEPGLMRLRKDISGGRVPTLLVWQFEGKILRTGVECGRKYDGSTALFESDSPDYSDYIIRHYGYNLCCKVLGLRESGLVHGHLSEQSMKLLAHHFTSHFNAKLVREDRVCWAVSLPAGDGGAAYMTARNSQSLEAVKRYLAGRGLVVRPRKIDGARVLDSMGLQVVAESWEWVTGEPSPALMFFVSKAGEVRRVARKLGGMEHHQLVILACPNLDANHPVLVHLRKEFP